MTPIKWQAWNFGVILTFFLLALGIVFFNIATITMAVIILIYLYWYLHKNKKDKPKKGKPW